MQLLTYVANETQLTNGTILTTQTDHPHNQATRREAMPESIRKVSVDVEWAAFDVGEEFVVGYGLDYDGRYRNLRDVATLAPHVFHH